MKAIHFFYTNCLLRNQKLVVKIFHIIFIHASFTLTIFFTNGFLGLVKYYFPAYFFIQKVNSFKNVCDEMTWHEKIVLELLCRNSYLGRNLKKTVVHIGQKKSTMLYIYPNVCILLLPSWSPLLRSSAHYIIFFFNIDQISKHCTGFSLLTKKF